MERGAVRVLVVEDDAALSEVLCDELRASGHVAVPAQTCTDALRQLEECTFDVALLDVMLPDGSGLDVLRRIASDELVTEAVFLTGYATVATALEATRLGAYDYLTKPEQMEKVDLVVRKAAEKARLRRENGRLRACLERQEPVEEIVTADPTMKEVLSALERVAGSDLPVLIEGESGTGKELLARVVHRQSPRAEFPFVALHCGAAPDGLVERELFGNENNVCELVDGGCVFLDEIGETPPSVQAKLLQLLDRKEFLPSGAGRPVRSDVRLIASASRDLAAETQAGRFRKDLYERLGGMKLRLPPLRERGRDMRLLAWHFLERFASRKSLSPGALEALEDYSWPGNVRELLIVIQRAAALAGGDTIEREDLSLDLGRLGKGLTGPSAGLTLAEMEHEYILAVLEQHAGHRGRTAKALGIDPKTLYNKLGPERPRKRT